MTENNNIENRTLTPTPIGSEFENRERQDLSADFSGLIFDDEDSEGTILVTVSTARGASPVKDALVKIFSVREGIENEISDSLTDASGKTPSVTVKAPNKENSQSPSDTLAFANYDILVTHPDYFSAKIDNVQVFGSEETIQTVDLVPLPEIIDKAGSTITTVIPKQNL